MKNTILFMPLISILSGCGPTGMQEGFNFAFFGLVIGIAIISNKNPAKEQINE